MTEDLRQRIEQNGRAAFINGLPDETCPHLSRHSSSESEKRTAWMTGWYAERINKNVGYILTKRGLGLM